MRKGKWGEEGEEVGERPGISGHFADEAKEEELVGKEKDEGKHEGRGGDKNYLLSSFLHSFPDQYRPRQ